MARETIIRACVVLWACGALALPPTHAAEIIYPVADGTLADGGELGDFDHVADAGNWAFEPFGFAGHSSVGWPSASR